MKLYDFTFDQYVCVVFYLRHMTISNVPFYALFESISDSIFKKRTIARAFRYCCNYSRTINVIIIKGFISLLAAIFGPCARVRPVEQYIILYTLRDVYYRLSKTEWK